MAKRNTLTYDDENCAFFKIERKQKATNIVDAKETEEKIFSNEGQTPIVLFDCNLLKYTHQLGEQKLNMASYYQGKYTHTFIFLILYRCIYIFRYVCNYLQTEQNKWTPNPTALFHYYCNE